MIKTSNVMKLSELSSSIVVPYYNDDTVNEGIVELLGYNPQVELNNEFGSINKISTLGKTKYPNIYFISLGNKKDINATKLQEVFASVGDIKEDNLNIMIENVVTDKHSIEEVADLFTETIQLATYSFTKINTDETTTKEYNLLTNKDITEAITKATITANAVNRARSLGNMPSNYMTPEILAENAIQLAQECNLEIEVLTNKELEKIGAGALLGVNKGSAHEARMIVLKYNGAKDEPYTALVGKGLTFDSGGYNLKPAASMTGMKHDMCGGANVLGALEIIAKRKLPANVYGIIPATENKINGAAYTCDDVLVSLSKKTIEITNTDAEGRLILCDAITYAQQLGATRIVDIATLTGACAVALGETYSGAFANDDDFYKQLELAATNTNENVWRMPLHPQYAQSLKKSIVADLVNSGSRMGGASVAAEFLHQFIDEGVAWIHLDIAGTSSLTTKQGHNTIGATGAMVKTMAALFE